MKTSKERQRDLIDLGRAVRETKGGAGDITDQVLKQPFGGLGLL